MSARRNDKNNDQVDQEVFVYSTHFFNQLNHFCSPHSSRPSPKECPSQRQYLVMKISQKLKSIQKLSTIYEQKKNQLADLRKLLLHVNNENDSEVENINLEIEQMQAQVDGYKAAMKASYQGDLNMCGLYWKSSCV